jgi:hypothetical protein
MGKQPRPPLLGLAILLIGSIPPYTPPGSIHPGNSKRAICPHCQEEASTPAGRRFYCSNCDEYFTPKGKGAPFKSNEKTEPEAG